MSIGLYALISGSRSQLSLPGLLSSSLNHTTKRFRSGQPAKKHYEDDLRQRSLLKEKSSQRPSPAVWSAKRRERIVKRPQLNLSLDDPNGIINHFQGNVQEWSTRPVLFSRLESFGIPKSDIRPLLDLFVSDVLAGKLSTNDAYEKYTLDRFARSMPEDLPQNYSDIVYTGIFYAWAADPTNRDVVKRIIQPSTLLSIQRLFQAARNEHPADKFYETRRSRRKIIMHVGPTNSGKTHHALRALAAAPTGVYAGPLRLLAHEIWERLNLGQIVPAGVDDDALSAPPTTDSNLDVAPGTATTPAIRSRGNPKFARACNMITGEEHKIVSEDAMLESSTVEMLSTSRKYDVAVIDEIQMIADVERGYAWTSAVLGINAKEVHLCGEETAVPIIQALLAETGDELVVNRYKRLTPLSIGPSINHDFRKIEKGDCVVTFSRNSIFYLKRAIETATGMKCAVVYGKLPPEIRSGQAALFNDPNSEYDVIIGSDAIGMGLNLKIRRIIFEAVSKWDGGATRYLTISQTKQIAGRAGRFGMVRDKVGGIATTLLPDDVPFLENAISTPFTPLPAAILSPGYDSSRAIAQALPPSASLKTIYDAHVYVAKTKCHYRFSAVDITNSGKTVDEWGEDLSLEDRITFLLAPVPWRDEQSTPIIHNLVKAYTQDLSVPLIPLFHGSNYVETLLDVENKMKKLPQPKSDSQTLITLEGFHKILGLYAWLAFRNPVAFFEPERVEEWKPRVERALHWALQGVTRSSSKKSSPLVPTNSHHSIQYTSPVRRNKKVLGGMSGIKSKDSVVHP